MDYQTPLKEIISAFSHNQIREINIETGYYAICWDESSYTSDIDSMNIPIITKVSPILKTITSTNTALSDISNDYNIHLNWIGYGHYDKDKDFSITYNRYTTGFIKISEIGKKFHIISNSMINSNAYTMVAFDENKNPVWDESIINDNPFNYVRLSDNVHFVKFYRQIHQILKVTSRHPLKQEHRYIDSLHDFILNDGWTLTDNVISSTENIGFDYPLYTGHSSCEDDVMVTIDVEVITNNGNFEFIFGKAPELIGTSFGLKLQSNKSYLVSYMNNDKVLEVPLKYITLKPNTRYIMTIIKETTDTSHFNIRITDYKGNVETINGIGNNQTITEYNITNNDSNLFGYMWGRPRVVVITGGLKIHDFNVSYDYDTSNLKCIITGHSFIEGNSIPYNKTKRFSSMLREEIGHKKCLIFGKGGGTESMVDWVSHYIITFRPKYVLICLGTNDADSEYVC